MASAAANALANTSLALAWGTARTCVFWGILGTTTWNPCSHWEEEWVDGEFLCHCLLSQKVSIAALPEGGKGQDPDCAAVEPLTAHTWPQLSPAQVKSRLEDTSGQGGITPDSVQHASLPCGASQGCASSPSMAAWAGLGVGRWHVLLPPIPVPPGPDASLVPSSPTEKRPLHTFPPPPPALPGAIWLARSCAAAASSCASASMRHCTPATFRGRLSVI